MIFTTRIGISYYLRWTTHDPATAAAADASSQTIQVYEDAVDSPSHTLTAVNVATGHYRARLDVTLGNGYEVGKTYNVVVEATVGGVTMKAVILTFYCSTYDIEINGGLIDTLSTDLLPVIANVDVAVSTRAATGDAMTLTSGAVDAILDDATDGAYTLRQLVRLMAAALAGKASGGGTTTITFRDVNDTKNRIVATVDVNGNRTAVTLDGT